MSTEFLRRLFAACSDDGGNGWQDGLNLSELYERIEDTAEAERVLGEACEKARPAPDVDADIFSAAYSFFSAYERQGFINSFRLCARLGRELGEKGAAQ